MRILMTGAAGMIGRKLTARLLKDGKLAGRTITALDLHDIVPPETPAAPGIAVAAHTGDLAEPSAAAALVKAQARHRVPSGRHRVGRGRSQFRPGLPRQFRRHAGAVRCGQAGRPQPARRLHLVDRRVRRAVPRCDLRRFPADAADLLRHAEAGRRADPRRLYAARLLRRRRHPAADHLRAAGQAEQGGVGFFSGIIREPLAGQEAILPVPRKRRAHPCQPALGGEFPGACGRASTARRSGRAATSPCPASASPSASRSSRCGASPAPTSSKLIREEPDETIWEIVQNWPTRFDAKRARALGFAAEDELRRDHPRAYRG